MISKGKYSVLRRWIACILMLSVLSGENYISHAEPQSRDEAAHLQAVYLPDEAVSSLSEREQEAYREACDEIALWSKEGKDIRNIVLYIDEDGHFGYTYFVPNEDFADPKEAAEITLDGSDVTGEEDFGALNYALAENCFLELESVSEEDAPKYSLLLNADYFRNQLPDLEKAIFDAAKESMVDDNLNGFTYLSDVKLTAENVSNAISALNMTYPGNFEWVEKGSGGWSAKLSYPEGGYQYTITVKKSEYYSEDILSEAHERAREIVKEAKRYAETQFPDSPTYGVIKYCNDWICQNSYYNHKGTSSDLSVRATEEYFYCHSSAGTLLKGYGVCESYALAMQRFLVIAGIPSCYVVGYANGNASSGHAWNHVCMPDGKWYMLDPTWNDSGSQSSDSYFLSGADKNHTVTGKEFSSGMTLKFPELHSAAYQPMTSFVTDRSATFVFGAGENYGSRPCTLTSDNEKVAKITADGKIRVCDKGIARIRYNTGKFVETCTVYYFKWTDICFEQNKKRTLSGTYVNEDPVWDEEDLIVCPILVGKNYEGSTAESLAKQIGIPDPPAVSANPKTAQVLSCTFQEDQLLLKILPLSAGRTTIRVTFSGKTVTYTLTLKQRLQEEWFSELNADEFTYARRAIKPTCSLTDKAPKDLTCKKTYKDNLNAGTAKLVFTGTGNYCGTVTKPFQIKPMDLSGFNYHLFGRSRSYNAKRQPVNIWVRNGKSFYVKKGKDFKILYDGEKTAPKDAGSYSLQVVGTGNYCGEIVLDPTYCIKKISLKTIYVKGRYYYSYTGEAIQPDIQLFLNKVLLDEGDYETEIHDSSGAVVEQIVERGTYTIFIYPKGNLQSSKQYPCKKKKIKVR